MMNVRTFSWLLILSLVLALVAESTLALPQDKPKKERTPDAPAKASEEKKEEEKKPVKKEDTYFLLRGGDCYTVSGPRLPATDILVKNGVIQRLGKSLAAPEDAEILDVTGMRVYPGLVAVASSGIMGKEPPEHSTDLFGLNMVLGLAGGLTTVVTGNTAAKLTYGTTEGMVVKRNLFTNLSFSRRSTRKHQELREDFTRVRRYLRDLDAYEAEKARGVEEALEPDKKWLKGKYENYLKLMRGEITAKASAHSTQDLRDLCGLAERFGFSLVIAGGMEAWTLAAELGRAGVQLIFTPRRKGDASRRLTRPTGSRIETAAKLYEHGVNFAILPGSTRISLSGIAGRDIMSLPLEAAFAVRGGLSEEAAIRAITLGAAQVLGVDHRIGSIEEGKDADFIICDGDLLHYNTLVQWTMVNGRVVYDKEKESLFRHIRPRDGRQEKIIDFWPQSVETCGPKTDDTETGG